MALRRKRQVATRQSKPPRPQRGLGDEKSFAPFSVWVRRSTRSIHLDRTGTPLGFLFSGEINKGRTHQGGKKETKNMGYILDLEKELENRLTDLEEKRKQELIKFVKRAVLESYKNGIMAAKMVKAGKEAEKKTKWFEQKK